jgi:phenylalanyl-tRNA synthetase beta chain
MLVSYNWIKEYLGEAAPTPQAVADLLTFHAFEIEDVTERDGDTIFEVKILPDRGSDCLSQRGIAREVSTLTGVPLAHDPLTTPVTLPTTDAITVSIADPVASPRFTASLVTGVRVGPSPEWLKARLAALGQRTINNVVDATNYVMYAMGQPLHAYDAGKFPQVDGKYGFTVRPAVAGETVSLLAEGTKTDDRIVNLKGGELLIINTATDTAVGLAGVKGGRFAIVDETTTDLIIEAAHFHPTLTRRTARGLGIVIDASKRFENEPSRDLPPIAQQIMVDLIIEIAGGTCAGMIDVFLTPKRPPLVTIKTEQVNALLGINISEAEMVNILTRVGAQVESVSPGTLACTGPFERTDLTIAEDFIEEIGRVYGYHHVVSVPLPALPLPALNQRHILSEAIRQILVGQGFSEVITTSFQKKDEVALLSSLASDKSFLRSSLLPNLEEALAKNAPFTDLLGTPDTRIFEIGTVFHLGGEHGVTEHLSLALGVRLKTTGYSGKEDVLLSAVLTSLEPVLGPVVWNKTKGMAECNLTTVLSTREDVSVYEPVSVKPDLAYVSFSNYPSVSRDIAMWVEEGTETKQVADVLRDAAGPLLVRLTHLDTFTKDGRTSLAFRLVFQSNEKTLDGSEVDELMKAVYLTASGVGEVR